ncbi:neuropeptides capa receptor [Neodiprion virginianus]|uniref:Neuropeptides capa receptor n=1 Tax=Neodiprion lecontei TaxID=441921 RepID=A0ABM3FDB8_NEOLC|nr:neuropeptides capa receptor [Neodiprion lecontei]XP_046603234.1 neuropeptides capa receptor [Neodiprion virginianus]
MNDTNVTSGIFPIDETEQLEPDLAEVVIHRIQMYYTPVLVYLGALGNCLSVCVFFNSKLRKLSSSFYLAALAISDTGFLVSLFVVWLNMVDVGLFNRQGFCQFFIFLTTLCSFLSVWFVVAFTVERFVAVQYPLRRQSMCTVTRAKAVLVGLTVLGVTLCSPVLWFSSPQPPTEKHNVTLCNLAEEWEEWANVFNVADTVLTFILPFSVIVVLNSLIARAVWRLAGVRRTMTVTGRRVKRPQMSNGQNQRPATSQTKVTKMLLVVSTAFLCFNLPAYVMRLYAFFGGDSDRMTVILQHVCNLLFHTNFGINFALYCVSGQNFRRAVGHMLCPRPRRRHDTTQVTMSEYVRSSGSLSRRRTVTMNGSWRDAHELHAMSQK